MPGEEIKRINGPHIHHSEGGSCWNQLAASIISQAVADAKALKRGKTVDNGRCTEQELRLFFHSQYCGVLLGCTDHTGPEIAERLGL